MAAPRFGPSRNKFPRCSRKSIGSPGAHGRFPGNPKALIDELTARAWVALTGGKIKFGDGG